MIDLNKYDLIKNNENNSYYNIQKDLIVQYRKSGKIDYIVQLALLMIATPISDYYQSIRILYDCVISEDNYLAYVIGSYLSSTWLPFESNRFLRRLKERKGQFEFRIEEENRTIQIENKENGGINEICDPWKYINCEIKGYQ